MLRHKLFVIYNSFFDINTVNMASVLSCVSQCSYYLPYSSRIAFIFLEGIAEKFSVCAPNHRNCFISCRSVIIPIISIIGTPCGFRQLSLRCSCFKTELVIQGAWTARFTRLSRQGQFSSSTLLKKVTPAYHQPHQIRLLFPKGPDSVLLCIGSRRIASLLID